MPFETSSMSSMMASVQLQDVKQSAITVEPKCSMNSQTGDGLSQHRIITKEEAWNHTAEAYSSLKKKTILVVLFMIQVAMNMNGSLYANTQQGMSFAYKVDIQATTWGNMIFLVFYAFGCELWAPWSEELGRKWLMQASMMLVSIFTAAIPFAPNFATVLVLRFLTGIATAGGSLTLGITADMYSPSEQQNPVAFVALGSMLGSALPPIAGGLMEYYLPLKDSWRWCFWLITFSGLFVEALHLVLVPETFYKGALDKCARKRREDARREGSDSLDFNLYGPTEGIPLRDRFNTKEILETIYRPFKFLFTEPIVAGLSAISAIGDAIVFLFMETSEPIYGHAFGFDKMQTGFTFISLALGYVVGFAAEFLYYNPRNRRERLSDPEDEGAQFEGRMSVLCHLSWCLPLGLVIFAATASPSYGQYAWVGPVVGVFFIGIANYVIYAATLDYMVAAYGFYAASATGGNGFARDFLAGILTPAGGPWVKAMGPQAMCGILAALSLVFCAICVAVRYKGPWLRRRSRYTTREANTGREEEVGGATACA